MRAHLDEETTRLAAIWRITRKDGQQFFFTDHDRDVVFGGDTYRADAGFERTAIRSDAGFAVDNLDLVGVFAEGGIVEDALGIGRHVSGIADPFNGHIDEFRIAHVQRSDGWIETTWNNMSDPGAFAAASAEEQEGGGPPPLAGGGVVVCLMG
jgi:Uncharacterized conserved protein (DUF2163)